MKKVLVWDCDDTLWEGTVVEGEVELPDGRYELCEELFNRGVVQSTASHNLIKDVEQHLHKFELSNFFLIPQAEFGKPKAEMIEAVREQLGLSKQSDIVFVDDSVHNREEVKQALPDVIVISPGELEEVVEEHFTKDTYTDVDRNRVRMYRSEMLRKESGKSFDGDKLEFLRSCDLQVTIRKPTEKDMPRVVDLVARSNRLAAASEDFDKDKLYVEMGNLLVLEAKDKFGEYGISGVALDDDGVISLLVISCRLQGKGLGSTFLGSIINRHTGQVVMGSWYETEYNAGVRSLYEWYDFDIHELPVSRDDNILIVALVGVAQRVSLPDWVEVDLQLEYNVRFMEPHEIEDVKRLKGQGHIVKDFLSNWSWWDNWSKYPPIVLEHATEGIVGFHACTFTQAGYINSYYLWVQRKHRGKRLGGEMVDFMLREGVRRGKERLKFRVPKGGDGEAFWRGFGLEPIGEIEEEYFFDISLDSITDVASLIEHSKANAKDVTEDGRTLGHYKRTGVTFIHPSWRHLNE